MSTVYTWEEVEAHNSTSSCWIVYNRVCYDVTKFLDDHPGGAVLAQNGGKDCTKAFDDAGHSSYADELMGKYRIGVVEEDGSGRREATFVAESALSSVLIDGTSTSSCRRLRLPHDAEFCARLPARRRFAVAIGGALSRRECGLLRAAAERVGFRAAQFGAAAQYAALRRSSKCVIRDAQAAEALFARVRRWLPAEFVDESGRKWLLSRMHPRLKFLKYGPGEFFAPHRDGGQMGPGRPGTNTVEKSFVTIMIYLSDAARANFFAQDFDCVGGGLGFLSTSDARYPSAEAPLDPSCAPIGSQRISVEPEAGLFLAFEHGILHEGEPVISGTKYGIRTDIMYSSTGDDIPELIKRVAPDGFVNHPIPPDSYMDFGAAGGAKTQEEAMMLWLKRGGRPHRDYPSSDAEFSVGEDLFAINPKYRDGTRLRSEPKSDSVFNGSAVLNDTKVIASELRGEFALIKAQDGAAGWIRLRNLTRIPRQLGLPRVPAVDEMQLTAIDYYSMKPISLTGIKKPTRLEEIVAVVTGAGYSAVNGLYVIFKKEGLIKTYADRLMWWSAPSQLDTAFQLFCDGEKWWIGYGLYRWDTADVLPPKSGWMTKDKEQVEGVSLEYTFDEFTGEVASIVVDCPQEEAAGRYYRNGRENGHDRYEKRDGWFICSTGHHWWVSFDLYVCGSDPLTGEPPRTGWTSYPIGLHDPPPSISLCSRIRP